MKNKFDIIIMLGRPAAGKSEIIDFIKKHPIKERLSKYHIGEISEIDDFNFIWTLGEKDDKNEEKGLDRQYTKKVKVGTYAVKDDTVYTELIKEINKEFNKRFNDEFFKEHTLFIEFSRGKNFTYKDSLNELDDKILKHAIILYVNVSYQESIRKNKRRYKPEEADSILFHSVPDEIMEKYSEDDFFDLEKSGSHTLRIKGIDVPFLVFDNEPEKTDNDEKIKKELEKTLIPLWERINN